MWPRSIFGYDFFISYRRGDGTTAYALQLYEELRRRNYRCFVDRQEFEAGPNFERRLVRAVRASSELLLLLTPGVAESKYVRLEVRTALSKHRRIVPINLERAYHAADWEELAAQDLLWIDEREENLAAGRPSSEVLDEIERSRKKPRLNSIRLRLLISATALLFVLFVLSVYFGLQARKEANIAFARELAAQSQLVVTEQPSLLERAALLGVESLRRYPSLAGDIALRNTSRLLPTFVRRFNIPNAFFRNAAMSPDGRLVAASAGNEVALLNNAISAEVARFSHKKEILTVRFSPDGRFMATASRDGTAKIINVAERKEMYQLHHDPNTDVRSAIFSYDSQMVATAGTDNTARIWNVESGRRIFELPQPDDVEDVSFSPDARYIATGSQDQIARVWSLHPLQIVKAIKFGPERGMIAGSIRSQTVAFSPNGRWLAASGLNGAVVLVETRTWKEAYRLQQDSAVSDIRFTPDSRYLLTAHLGGGVIVWNVNNGSRVAELKHGAAIFSLAFSADGSLLATGSRDQTARVWDTASWNELYRVCAQAPIASVAFQNDATLVTAGQSLRLWDLNVGQRKLLSHADTVLGIVYSPDATVLATASPGLRIWNTRDWQQQDLLPGFEAREVAFSRDNKFFAAGSRTGEIAIFLGGPLQHLYTYKAHHGVVTSVSFSPDSRFLLSGGTDNNVVAWDVANNQEAWRYRPETSWPEGTATEVHFRFSPDGRWLALVSGPPAIGAQGKMAIMDWSARKVVTTVDTEDSAGALSWSPDGNLLAVGIGGSVRIIKTGKWNQQITSFGNQDVIRDIAFNHTGDLIASGGADGTVRIWETAKWTEIARVQLPSVVIALAFAPDERTFAASFNQMIQIDFVRDEDLIHEACSHLTRPLNNQEWNQYLSGQPHRPTCDGKS